MAPAAPEGVRLRPAVAERSATRWWRCRGSLRANRAIIGGAPWPLTWDYADVLLRLARSGWPRTGTGSPGALILEWRPDDLYIQSIAVAPLTQAAGSAIPAMLAHARWPPRRRPADRLVLRRPMQLMTLQCRLVRAPRLHRSNASRRATTAASCTWRRASPRRYDLPDNRPATTTLWEEQFMTSRLEGKRAFITAAGAGIGRATAIIFAAEGATIIATDLKAELVADLRRARHCRGLCARRHLDARRRGAGGGGGRRGRAVQAAPASSITAMRCPPPMPTGTSRSTSTSSRCTGRSAPSCPACSTRAPARSSTSPRAPARSAACPIAMSTARSKAAVIGLTKAVAADHIRQCVRVNAIAPGTISRRRSAAASPTRRRSPARRWTRSASNSSTASRWRGSARRGNRLARRIYLASDEASYTDGTVLLRRWRLRAVGAFPPAGTKKAGFAPAFLSRQCAGTAPGRQLGAAGSGRAGVPSASLVSAGGVGASSSSNCLRCALDR